MSNKQQKKIAMEDEKERSKDIRLYSIVEEKLKDGYPNKSEGTYTDLITSTRAPSFNRNKNSNKSVSEYERPNKNRSVSRGCFCVVIVALLLLILISLAASVIIYFMMRSSSDGDNQGNCNSLESSINEEFMRILEHKIEEIENNTKGRELDLLYLINQLDESNTFLKDKIKEINHALYGDIASSPASSCRAIYLLHPHSTSGYYWVTSSNGSSVRVYCDMIKSCGNITGGLTRVALLNNKTRPRICTGDFTTVNNNTRCVRNTEEPGCSHIVFPLMNLLYSHICGTVEGFWFGRPEGFTGTNRSNSTTINDNYVDGISLTYGSTTNRTHIWTFVADGVRFKQNCPRNTPDYVGNSYSCLKYEFSCSSNNSCSLVFFKQLQQPLTEDIEMRLCRDEHRVMDHEGIYVGNVEIYVW